MPDIVGESEDSTADFAGKAFIIPLGSAIKSRKKALVSVLLLASDWFTEGTENISLA